MVIKLINATRRKNHRTNNYLYNSVIVTRIIANLNMIDFVENFF